MDIPRIKDARAFDNHTLIVTFTNGARKKYDVARLLKNEMFAPLKNSAFFKNAQVDPGGYAVVWSPDIDISEHELWKNGEETFDP